jgi:aryl-alcohol dehydrogenase-like predicted oxidoreductase
MRYRLLGRGGLRVSELCLGAKVFGDTRGPWGATREDAEEILSRFAEAGGNFIDTASNYAGGESEHIVGELIASDRDRRVLATKYTCSSRPDDPNAGGSDQRRTRRGSH